MIIFFELINFHPRLDNFTVYFGPKIANKTCIAAADGGFSLVMGEGVGGVLSSYSKESSSLTKTRGAPLLPSMFDEFIKSVFELGSCFDKN